MSAAADEQFLRERVERWIGRQPGHVQEALLVDPAMYLQARTMQVVLRRVLGTLRDRGIDTEVRRDVVLSVFEVDPRLEEAAGAMARLLAGGDALGLTPRATGVSGGESQSG